MSETAIGLLPGQILTSLIAAALLAYPLARLLLWRYVRTVERTMRALAPSTGAPGSTLAAAPPRVAFAGSAGALLARLRRAPWRAASIQAGVALVVALYFAVLKLVAWDLSFSIYRIVAIAATGIWPGVLAVLLVAGISGRQRVLVLVVGAGLYLLFGIWAHVGPIGKALREIVTMWAVTNLPPSIYLAAFLTRRVRAIGPLVLLATLATTTGVFAILAVFQESPALLQHIDGVLSRIGIPPLGTLLVVIVAAGAAALAIGWWLVRRLAEAYARYRVGDEGLALAAMWLTFVIIDSIDFIFRDLWLLPLALLAFPLYLVLVRLARRLLLPGNEGAAPALLLLRVFTRRGPTSGLFHAISRHWRHVGPIRMVAGYDLASDAVEPDEMMAFLRGRLADSFVTGPHVVARRLAGAAPRRDADGRYRSEEFFCFDNTWRDTLRSLVASSAVVVMDLRGFGPDNRGCVFELQALAQFNVLDRTVVLQDETTKKPALDDALRELGIAPSSLNVLALKNEEAHDIPALLAALARNATRA
jgi:hypothetical protein